MCYSVVGLSLCQFLCVRYLCSRTSSISSTIQNLLVRILAHFVQFQQLKSLGGFTSPLVMFFFLNFTFSCIVECERWKRADNVSAENGEFYAVSSLTECMNLCLSKLTCVAVDTWSDVCSLHTNASDLLSSHATSGVSQFVLDRSCAVSTASASSTETTFSTVSDTGFCAILSQFSSYYSVCNLPLVL